MLLETKQQKQKLRIYFQRENPKRAVFSNDWGHYIYLYIKTEATKEG